MNEQWEMCLIISRHKQVYSPGVEKKYTAFTGQKGWEAIRDEAITELLSDGWEPFAASDSGNYPSLYFRRRIS